MSKQKQAVFVDVSRHREERRAPNDKRLIYIECLMRCSLLTLAACRIKKCTGTKCAPMIKHGLNVSFLFLNLKMLKI